MDSEAFAQDLDFKDLENESDLISLITKFEGILKINLDKHTPEKTKRITVRDTKSWFTESIREQKKIMRRREKIWRKYKQDSIWRAFDAERVKYRSMLRQAKLERTSEKVLECSGNIKICINWC